MATPTERTQLKTAYEVIRSEFLGEYDRARQGDKPTPKPSVMRYNAAKWHGDYAAYRHYAKDTAWLETQFSVV